MVDLTKEKKLILNSMYGEFATKYFNTSVKLEDAVKEICKVSCGDFNCDHPCILITALFNVAIMKGDRTRKDTNMSIENNFKYHAPKGMQPLKYTEIREKGKEFANMIMEDCPDSRERSLAITKIEEAVMWANAAIARNE